MRWSLRGSAVLRRACGIAALVLAACSEEASGPQLRKNVRVVHEFPTVEVSCLEFNCSAYVSPTIVDVAREGRLIALLYSFPVSLEVSFVVSNGLLVSRDGGETWETMELGDPGAGDGTGARGVAIRDGEVYVTTPYRPTSGIGGATRNRHAIARAGATRASIGSINAPMLIDAPTSLHRGVFSYDYWGPSAVFTSRIDEFDLLDASQIAGKAQTLSFPLDQTPCGGDAVWRLDGAGTARLFGSCHQADLACIGIATLPDRWIPYFRCVPEASWPVPSGERLSETTVGSGVVLFQELRDGAPYTRAARIRGTSASAVDVGPGVPLLTQPDAGFDLMRPVRTPPMHSRWGSLVALFERLPEDGSRATLYRTAGSGFVATALPTRPCADGAFCGHRVIDFETGDFQPAVIQWALPMGDDDYLLFYVLDQRPDMQHLRNTIYVSREHLDRGQGTPGSPIEVACARASVCTGFPQVRDCVTRWMDVAVPPSAVAAFTSATSCEALLRADASSRLGTSCRPDGPRCDGTVGTQCSGGMVIRAIDCAARGGTCALPGDGTFACEFAVCPAMAGTCDGSGRVVWCGDRGIEACASVGVECVADGTSFGCLDDGSNCAGASLGAPACAGDVSVHCQASGRGVPYLDCSRVGATCDPATIDPETICAGDGSCDDTFVARCEGAHLRYCLYESLRDVDCASVGGVCSTEGVARCAPGSKPEPAPDAGMSMPDVGPSCSSASLGGPLLSEVGTGTYPTPTGGPIEDGTYVLTAFEVWSSTPQPYTHRETLVVSGGTFERTIEHSALGTNTTSGAITTSGTDLTLSADCPAPMPDMHRYIASGDRLVLLQSSFIRTFRRM